MTASAAERVRVFRSSRVIAPGGETAATVHVRRGRIERVAAYDDVSSSADVIDVGDLALLPGFVDSHVHVNEPGRTDWEGFELATRAAASGGVTTLVDMPLNSVPSTTTVVAFDDKLRATRGKLSVDVAFWGGVIPGNRGELRALHEAGVVGFKCFLAPSGVSEFPHVTEDEMEIALTELAPLRTPLLVHAEDPSLLGASAPTSDYSTYLATRPVDAEISAVRSALRTAERTGGHVHIVHASAAETVAEVTAARAHGIRATVETCPHYLWFEAGEIGAGRTEWKCAPPIRDARHRSMLRRAVRDRLIDLVASDHSPAPPELKQRSAGDFMTSWGGISSLQIAPLVTWSVMRELGCTLAAFSSLVSAGPARLAGISSRKGAIVAGSDADVVAFDEEAETRVVASELHHRHKLTPYDGAVLRGRVVQTWLRGESIYERGKFPAGLAGRAILRRSD